MTIDEIRELHPKIYICDGFDEAIIGLGERINLGPVVAYDTNKVIEILMRDMDVSVDDLEEGQTLEDAKYELALEYFNFNILGAWIGESTPLFITI